MSSYRSLLHVKYLKQENAVNCGKKRFEYMYCFDSNITHFGCTESYKLPLETYNYDPSDNYMLLIKD